MSYQNNNKILYPTINNVQHYQSAPPTTTGSIQQPQQQQLPPSTTSIPQFQVQHQQQPQVVYVQQVPTSQIENRPLLPGAHTRTPKRKRTRGCCCCIISTLIIVSLLIVGTICGAYFGVMASKCANPWTFSETKQVTIGSATKLVFNGFNGHVRLLSGEDHENVTIYYKLHASDESVFENMKAGTVIARGVDSININIDKPSNNHAFICYGVSAIITIPRNSTLSVSLTTSNGDVFATEVETQDLTIGTSNGELSFEKVTATKINAYSSNGRIDLSAVSAVQMVISSSNGKIYSDTYLAGEDISLRSSNGNVHLNDKVYLQGKNKISVVSSNGNINFSDLEFAMNSAHNNVTGHGGHNKTRTTTDTTNNEAASATFISSNGRMTGKFVGYAGKFDISSSNGDITLNGNAVTITKNTHREKQGTIGNDASKGSLIMSSSNGDVTMDFN